MEDDSARGGARLFDDAAKLAEGALGALAGVRREVETLVRHQVERLIARMDLVTREEFEAVKAMAAKARDEQEDLLRRIAELEAAANRRRRRRPDAEPGK